LRREGCRLCAGDAFAFDAAACATVYGGAVRDAIVAYKLAGERRAAATFARWVAMAAARLRRPDAIAWVPSTRKTLSARGFDPAGEIARAFAELVGMRASPLVRKIRDTSDQAGLDRAARRNNLVGAFDVPAQPPPGVLVVDDILTTGATADACARALKAGGARYVQIVAVARAV
jgi:predicted amidophosphoribosyltransferase